MMNIKSRSAHELAKQLAQLTGETMTAAVEQAVRERLVRLKKEKSTGMAARLLAIGDDCAPRLAHMADHGDILYGEDGLPR